jgi:hypothetical protein
MTDCLVALVKHIAKLCQAELDACHYVEEFQLRRIRPLDHRKTLVFKCSWMADPSRDPLEGNIFVLSFCHYWQICSDLTYPSVSCSSISRRNRQDRSPFI